MQGIIEGDPEFLEVLYEAECADMWAGDWLIPEMQGPGGDAQLANVGPFILAFQPRSDGPAFVQQTREAGGWDAVNDLYENPPQSTEQLIHPNKFPDDEPTKVEVGGASADNWEQVRVPNRPDTATLGEAGVFSMFMFPTFDGVEDPIIPASEFRNTTPMGELQSIDGLDYNHRFSAGWDGDTLVPYVNERGEGGYVWKLVWDSERDAEEFVEGYRQLLELRNAEPVDGREGTYRIPEGERFADAFYVQQEGDTVVIVNAPTVDELSEVRATAAPEAES